MNYKWKTYDSKLKEEYKNIQEDYNNCQMKIKDIMVKYNIKSPQTIYNIIKIINLKEEKLTNNDIFRKQTTFEKEPIKQVFTDEELKLISK